MVKNNYTICPTCGRKIIEHTHSINKTMILGLRRLYDLGGLARLDKLDLTNSQFTNFQKLQYFNLIVKSGKNSAWQITRLGNDFLRGQKKIPQKVITRGGVPKQVSVDRVFVNEVKECIQYKVEWQENARRPNLFDPRD